MTIQDYIVEQPVERRQIMADIHALIIAHDKTVTPAVEPMMGKEMILYKAHGLMKYGLAGVKNYMSLHVMPIYASPPLFNRYKALLNHAVFQKGCINFSGPADMPLSIVQQLIADCARVDLAKIKEEYMQAKKAAKKK